MFAIKLPLNLHTHMVYNNEVKAAIAYNIKEIELYGSLMTKYKVEVL